MNILDQLIHLMLQKTPIKAVNPSQLDDFLSQHNIIICKDYYQFLLNYGNSDFLSYDYANLTFDGFKSHYLDDDLFDDATLPPNCDYLGMDYSTEIICLNCSDKQIYGFGYGKTNLLYYGGLKELLFFSLLQGSETDIYFDKVTANIIIDDIKVFKEQYLNYEIKDIHHYTHYFLKDNQLIVCDDKFHSYHLFEGGILNHTVNM